MTLQTSYTARDVVAIRQALRRSRRVVAVDAAKADAALALEVAGEAEVIRSTHTLLYIAKPRLRKGGQGR